MFQGELDKPQRLQTLKIDFNASPTNLISATWSRQQDRQTGTIGLATPNSNWPRGVPHVPDHGNIVSVRYQKIFSPTLVNEFIAGYNWRYEFETIPDDQLAKLTKSAVGFNVRPTVSPRRTRRI